MDTSFIQEHRGKPLLLKGSNFSGRTHLLRHWCREVGQKGEQAIYVGPNVHQSISSLVPTVRDELLLHAGGRMNGEAFFNIASTFGLEKCLDQSPFTLSGGEQVLLVTLAKLALGAGMLALDGSLEQLDQDNSNRVIELLSSGLAAKTTTILTANGYPEDQRWIPSNTLLVDNFDLREKFGDAPRFQSSDFKFGRATGPQLLEVENLSFAYPRSKTVLRNIHLRLEPGYIYSLEGRNGSGKSTLARIFTGALRAHSGRFRLDGKEWNPWANPGSYVVMHLQNPDIQLFSDSVAKELGDLPPPINIAAATFAGVHHLMDEHPFDLPFVFRKRLTFSAVAHLSKPWFIFDEPNLGQDERACDQIVLVLRKIVNAGAGVIVISHSTGLLNRLEPRRLRLDGGCLAPVEPR